MDFSSINSNLMNQAAFAISHRNPTISGADMALFSEDDAELMYAAQKFEGYFLQMMFRAMRDTVHSDDGILPQSETQRIFQDMLDEQTAIAAAQGGGMGLAQQIFNQMTAHRSAVQDALISENAYYGNHGLE
ncbi:MAG: rod-binding protein [Clostridiales bacterium]|jgi:flagellar protein FlgJ|nr:rod-binding protein [Clostridiales bacterium]